MAATPPPVPSTSIFSRTDGIADWKCCVEKTDAITENISVFSSHAGLGHNPLVLWIIADRLSQRENAWTPFDSSGIKDYLYGDDKSTRGLGFI